MNQSQSRQIAERFEQVLDRQIETASRGRRRFTLFATIVLIAMVTYFSVVAGIIRRELNPKDLAKVLGAFVSDYLVSTIKETSDSLTKMAPDQTGGLLDTGLLHVFGWSKEARFFVIGWLDERLEHVEKLVTRLLDSSYEQHSADLKLLLREIKTPAGKKAFEEYFVSVLAAPLANESVRIDIESLDMTLVTLHERLTRLGSGQNLSEQEAAERELLLAFREFWERNLPH